MSNKILVIMAHPNMDESIFNTYIRKELEGAKNVMYKDLTSLYRDSKIDVKQEQKDLLEATKIVFQFPMQWYSSPSILKQYVDEVFEYDYAYNIDENGVFQALKLKEKEFQLLVTVGSRENSFTGEGRLSVKECLNAYSYTAKMLGMKEIEPCFFYGTAFDKYSEEDFNKIRDVLKTNIL